MVTAVEPKTQPSISTTANLHVVNDPTSLAVGSVTVAMELFVRLFPNTQTDLADNHGASRFVLIKFIGVPDFFPKLNIYKISAIDYEAPTPNSVTVTNHPNLVRFESNLTVRGCVIQSIDEESIPFLDDVFVSVPDTIYEFLNNAPYDAVKEKFLTEYTSANGCVVAQNDVVRALNGTVLLTNPFHQGKVGPSTNLVFVKRSEAGEDEPATPETDSEDIDVDLSQYLSKSVVLGEGATAPQAHQFKIKPLPQRISILSSPVLAEDPELFVFTSTDDLSRLGFPVFNGDLVELSTGHENVIVKVFTVLEPNKSFEKGTLYLSPLLLINLNSTESTAVLRPMPSNTQDLQNAIPIAKSATISRVVSPITMDKTYQQSFFAELKSTFHSQMKCFRKGDMFPVCIDSLLARCLFESSAHNQKPEDESSDPGIVPSGNPDSVAWFKVVDITGENGVGEKSQFRIDPSKTSLTSSGVEFTRLPRNKFNKWYEYLELPPLFDYLPAIESSPSTFKYAQEFYQVITTAIESNMRIGSKTAIMLHSMTRGLGKSTLVRSAALQLGLNYIEIDAFEIMKPGAELKTIGLLTGKIEKQLNGQNESSNCTSHHILFIKHADLLCVQADPNEQGASSATSQSLKITQALREIMDRYENLILVASCNDADKVSDAFRQMMLFEIAVTVPTEQERLEIFKFLLENEMKVSNNEDLPKSNEDKREFTGKPHIPSYQIDIRRDVKCSSLALQSAGLTPRDLMSILKKAKQMAVKRLLSYSKNANTSIDKLIRIGNGGSILALPADFDSAINEARNQFSDSIGAPRIPNVKWEDIGGLDMVKDEILDTIDMPLKHPELFSNGLKKRSGILFYGPPGTGKTLLAKAIATNFSLNFFSVKGPELLNMYIGESEANVRRVFQKARDSKPCVIFFDELDSVAPKRGNQGDSGGVMDRIVSQLLAELDGMSGGENNGDGVFVVGATNRPDLLDEALLRPGRFDKMLYLGISDTDEKQTKILEALTRKFRLSDEVDLAEIAKKCSFNLTGADFYALCSDSMLNAMTRTANEVDRKLSEFNAQRAKDSQEEVSSRWWFDNIATAEDITVLVTFADFVKAQEELVPSVSIEELGHYLRVKENFEGGKKAAQNGAANGHLQNGNGH